VLGSAKITPVQLGLKMSSASLALFARQSCHTVSADRGVKYVKRGKWRPKQHLNDNSFHHGDAHGGVGVEDSLIWI
jgi:hypothetical protein